MARQVVVACTLLMSPMGSLAHAADSPENPWHADQRIHAARSFDLPDQSSDEGANKGMGSRIFAGQELMPNGVIGFGMFGQKADKSPHAAATARDLALPKPRKAAVGFSLKF